MAGQAAAEADADVAEGEVDLVVDDEHALELDAVAAARGADRATGVVHEGLRLEDRDARAAGPGAALGQLGVELLLRLRELPAPQQLVGDAKAHVVRGVRVARPGVAEPDDQPVDGGGAEELQLSSPEACAASSAVSPSACRSASSRSAPSSGSPSSPTSAVSVSISSSTGSSVGGVMVAMTVSSRSSSSVTPSGTVTAARVSVSFISILETSCWMTSGRSSGSASTLTSRVSWLSTPPSLTPGASSPPTRSSTAVEWMGCDMSTRSRSTWIASPRTGWFWTSLTMTGVALPPSTARSRTEPECASAARSVRALTAKVCGSSPPP